MSRYKDIAGQRFGKYIVLKFAGTNKHGCAMWICQCDCGTRKKVLGASLRSGSTKSCGCHRIASIYKYSQKRALNLVGKRFGKLTVIKKGGSDKSGHIRWLCLCDCGNQKEIAGYSMKRGCSRSCGCSSGNILPKGQAAFNNIYNRYYKVAAKVRGIIFELTKSEFRELSSKHCFYCGEPPRIGLADDKRFPNGGYAFNGLDRIDNNKGYTIDNCVPCCKICNYMKSNLPVSEFIAHVKQICKHQNNQHIAELISG